MIYAAIIVSLINLINGSSSKRPFIKGLSFWISGFIAAMAIVLAVYE